MGIYQWGLGSKFLSRGFDAQQTMAPPLSENLRDFPLKKLSDLLLRWDLGDNAPKPAFQSFNISAVHLPESFRGGCSFGSDLY